jgi:preprotein translocase subunit SecA
VRDARCGEALALAAAAMQRSLGYVPYDTQLRAAWLMIDGALVEMATGEGKTLAAGLAAAVSALRGVPVHVLTANDYLVQRDRDAMAPMFELLGLRSAAVTARLSRDERHDAYRHDIVYATGREVVFDYLKDHVALGGERDPRMLRARALGGGAAAAAPVLPGLHQALIDEADSILLDEACIPFILAAPGAAPAVEALDAARAVAARLGAGEFILRPAARDAQLTQSGLDRLTRELQPAGPLWPLRHGQELVRAALVAEHLMLRDRDYALRPDGIALIDEVTGRIAQGRQWTGPLQAMVELKEGRVPSAASSTAARITFQRFFPRYLRLGGMSGTLRESRGELESLYACPVVRLPLAQPSRARWLGTRGFVSAAVRWAAVVQQVRACVAAGRPVLVGTDSVAASRALSAALDHAAIPHQVLNAVQDADEAALVAQAGQAGRVTVATNIAGRGTDIRLDAAAHAAGGLHVILALANRSRRIDRQLRGRGARHGDPGSAERLLALDDAVLALWPRAVRRAAARTADAQGELPSAWTRVLLTGAQHVAEWRTRLLRRDLRLADKGLPETYRIAGSTE